MTDTSRPTDDTVALHEAVQALSARLDRIEAQAAQPSALDSAKVRLSGAWDALRGGTPDSAPSAVGKGLLRPILTVCAGLLALILAVEVAEEVFDGLWHLGRWID